MHTVVIVGGGFGGLEAAKALAKAPVRVVLIDRRNHHLFQPLLYQVATAGLNPADIAQPIRSILRSQENAEVMLAEVAAVDSEQDRLVLTDGTTVDFDHLILAAGARHAYFGHPEWEQHAPGLKSIEDALEIRRRVLTAFEYAEACDDDGERAAALTFVVVGAGPTGVELAGAIAGIATHTLARDFRRFDPATARIVLLDGADRVLTSFHPTLSDKARRQLQHLGVEVQTDTFVTDITAEAVAVESEGRPSVIPTRTVLWAAGVEASPLGASLHSEQDRSGRVTVDEHLAVPSRSNIFIIGDMAAVPGEPVPGVAPAAVQAGRLAANNIVADLEDRGRTRFVYRDKGSLAAIGRSEAVLEIGRIRMAGFLAWIAWWAVHIALLVGFRSRTLVMFGWAWNWLTHRAGARLITGAWRPLPRRTDRLD